MLSSKPWVPFDCKSEFTLQNAAAAGPTLPEDFIVLWLEFTPNLQKNELTEDKDNGYLLGLWGLNY